MELLTEDTMVVLVDIQERLVPAMDGGAQVVDRAKLFLKGAKVLGLPLLATEQYPKGLGKTVPELQEYFEPGSIFEKIHFSALGEDHIEQALARHERRTIILLGMETHVCVYQTARDLLEAGFRVVALYDCIASRSTKEKDLALDHMSKQGVEVRTMESVLFELCGRAGTPEFKEISAIAKLGGPL